MSTPSFIATSSALSDALIPSSRVFRSSSASSPRAMLACVSASDSGVNVPDSIRKATCSSERELPRDCDSFVMPLLLGVDAGRTTCASPGSSGSPMWAPYLRRASSRAATQSVARRRSCDTGHWLGYIPNRPIRSQRPSSADGRSPSSVFPGGYSTLILRLASSRRGHRGSWLGENSTRIGEHTRPRILRPDCELPGLQTHSDVGGRGSSAIQPNRWLAVQKRRCRERCGFRRDEKGAPHRGGRAGRLTGLDPPG